MTATAPLLSAEEWADVSSRPTKDKRYLRLSRSGGALADYLAWAENEAGKRPRTLDQYERDIARVLMRHPHLKPEDWRKEHIRAGLLLFPEGSRYRAWAALRDFWNWQYDEERVDANPMRGIRQKRQTKKRVIRTFTDGELAALVNAANATLMPEVNRARILLLQDAGARAGEALDFRPEHANLAAAKPYVLLRGKGDQERRVPIGSELVRALEAVMVFPLPKLGRPLATEEFLFFPARVTGQYGDREEQVIWLKPGKAMVYSSFWRWFKGLSDRAGIKYRKPHTTRHTYATDLLTATGDLVSVKDALGHASSRSTEVYLHNVQKRLESAVDALETFRNREGQGV
jgi:site-specific recombinase XerD